MVVHTRRGQKTDKELTQKLWGIMNQADIVVAHNAAAFDVKKSQAKFLEHSLAPLKPYKIIDTLKVARSQFKLTNNRLSSLGELLKVGGKKETTGFDLWLGCMADEPKSWRLMAAYNKQDVVLLERVYLKLRPWIKNHPHVNYELPGSCPKCGSFKIDVVHLVCQHCKGRVKPKGKQGVYTNG